MLFSSITFLFYFLPIILLLYYACFFSRMLQNLLLLVASLMFYAWGEPKMVFLMLASIIINYIFGLLVYYARNKKRVAKTILTIMVMINIGLLFVFKYLVFTVESINSFGGNLSVPSIALPIGISFFTFQAISYVVDVYRGDGEVQKNPFNTALYISFFPQLIAGPIVRYSTFQKQIKERKESIDKLSVGICRFIVGLGKKVIIANQMAIVTDRIYGLQAMGGLAISSAWIGAISYTFQIFFDFSGYSDMATGLALMFGFKFEKNFDYPYIAKSISEFWRRWHISLSTWFRDYVYIPLGGSRVENKDIVIRNLAIVWMLTGIWHGANWTFFLWGLLNMLFIVAEKIIDFEKLNINNKIKHVYMLFIVCIGWVIFRSDSLTISGSYIGNMFNIIKYPIVDSYSYMFIKEYFVFFIAAITFSMPIAAKVNEWFMKGIPLRKVVQTKKPYETSQLSVEPPLAGLFNVGYPIVMMGLLMICVTYLIKGNYNPFIYFKF